MRKFGIFTATIFLSAIIAGLYGILHDQVTYSICPEYFTKFKYRQFGFDPNWFGGQRQTVAVIGFLATWWTGIIIGFGIGLTGLIYKDHKQMAKSVSKSIMVVFITALIFGVVGFFYGKYHLTKTGVDWWLPEDLNDTNSFIIVGSIHNFSYLGGLAGLFAGIIYLFVRNKKEYYRYE